MAERDSSNRLQMAELEFRLAEANEAASKGGRNALSRLESRIQELELELGSCQSRTRDRSYEHPAENCKWINFFPSNFGQI
jgi:hypothetical protein